LYDVLRWNNESAILTSVGTKTAVLKTAVFRTAGLT